MSIHLIGGGRDEARGAEVLAPFVAEARDAAASAPLVIALLLVLEEDDDTSVDRFTSLLVAAGARPESVRVAAIVEADVFTPAAVDGAHGIFVGGGLTPAYHDAVIGIAADIRRHVEAGTPYAGFSAGAAIAASSALVGGYVVGGVIVSPEDAGEELDELEVREGIGLVTGSVDVHAAQWGTVGRLIAAVEAGLTTRGVAIDEHTTLVVDTGEDIDAGAVRGAGRVWDVVSGVPGVDVSTRAAH